MKMTMVNSGLKGLRLQPLCGADLFLSLAHEVRAGDIVVTISGHASVRPCFVPSGGVDVPFGGYDL